MYQTYSNSNDQTLTLTIMLVILIIYLIIIGMGIANYVLSSISLHKIAKRRQIANAWLAWIPIGNYWITGSIADEYDSRKGIKRKWRVVLLTLSLIFISAFILFYIFMIIATVKFAFRSGYTQPTTSEMLGLFIPMYIFLFIMIIPAAALSTCYMICFYKVFESTVPEKSVKYLLLSLLVPFASAVCLFMCRNKGYSKPMITHYPTPPMPYPQKIYK